MSKLRKNAQARCCMVDTYLISPVRGLRQSRLMLPRRLTIITMFVMVSAAGMLCSSECILSAAEPEVPPVQFNRDIRPILSDRCFVCHGPDQSSKESKETDLRLDLRESAIEDIGAIAPGDAAASELLDRVTSRDPDLQMPPPGSHKLPLGAEEIGLIRRWIDQGAEYEKHWSFIPPTRPDTPQVKNAEWTTNPIDTFVLARLEQEGIAPSPEADRRTLIRRVTLDLTGLPPTPADVAAFVNDPAPLVEAYEKVVDRLLGSQRYGEQMARFWLDAARYADTSGYQYDLERKQWVWRDWVINAFNKNMPFDQFTIEQIAGDLLPEASDQSRLATAFHRNHPITIEGGVIDEEYRIEYVIDRVVTTSTVWLGMTFTCSRCHDHKYDPISQEDFYSFSAFFNSVPERGLNGFNPKRKIVSPFSRDRLAKLDQQIATLRQQLVEKGRAHSDWESQLRADLKDTWVTPPLDQTISVGGATLRRLEDGSILASGKNPPNETYEISFSVPDQEIRTVKLEVLTDPSLTRSSTGRGSNGNFVLTEFEIATISEGESEEFETIKIASVEADYQQKGFPVSAAIDGKSDGKGWGVDGHEKRENRTALFTLAKPIPAGAKVRVRLIQEYGNSHQFGRFRLATSPDQIAPQSIRETLAQEPDKRSSKQASELQLHLIERFGGSDLRKQLLELDRLQSEFSAIRDSFPQTMVMAELKKPRTAYVLERGEYDKPRKDMPLSPGVPSALGSLNNDAPTNRLGLAQWLVSRDQPLTARVTANRFWQQVFGVGLVKTSEDFGSQGEWPSHPELLDWLAVEFMESGWDVKRLRKTIVMSSVYRQSSHVSKARHSSDPENRLLARGPRFRLEGEIIRDSALAVSGLLDTKVGGESVYPYHPQGLWLEINNRPNLSRPYPHPQDRDQFYRRSMYTFWKRTVPPPSLATFDAPGREYCIVRRSRTNTPLQAFVMLHDPQFVEAARQLAARMMTEGGVKVESRIQHGFTLCTSREPNPDEMNVLRANFEKRNEQYQADPEAAQKLMSVGISQRNESLNLAEHAAYTQIARMLLNLSEFLTKG